MLAETSGRFDHIIGNINTLYKSDRLVGNIRVEFLFDRLAITSLLHILIEIIFTGDTSRKRLFDMDIETWFAQYTYTRELGTTEILVWITTVRLSR